MLVAVLLTLLGLATILVPLYAYFPSPPDAVPLVLLAAGAVAAWVQWKRRKGRGRMAGAVTITLLFGVVAYWFLLFSAYAKAPPGAAVGGNAPTAEVRRVSDGVLVRLPRGDPASQPEGSRSPAALLVFYRGAW